MRFGVASLMLLAACGRLGFDTDGDPPSEHSYRDEVLADRPVGYWRLGDRDAIARDELGGADGTIEGACTTQMSGALSGDADTAIKFDGSTCKISLGDRFGFLGNAPYTLEVWVDADGSAEFGHVLTRQIRVPDGSEPTDGWALLAFGSDGYYTERAVANDNIESTHTPLLGGFHHLIGRYDGSRMMVLIDGTPVDAGTPAGEGLLPISTTVIIGATELDANHFFAGVIDEVAIYATALSNERILAHYQIGITGPSS